MKIAVIGAGASGLVAAYRLTKQGHDVSVFEAGDRCGGHAQSVSLESAGVREPIEVGFYVFNQAACPRLSGLLSELQTPTREFDMAYEIRDSQSRMILRGGSLRELFSVPTNLTFPSFYRVVPDWIRFTRKARRLLSRPCRPTFTTLGEFLHDGAYSEAFVEQFVYPLAGTVCPLNRQELAETPLASLIGFIHNHGLMQLTRDQSCRTLTQGSSGYLDRLTDRFRDRIQLNCPIAAIARHDDYVQLKFPNRPRQRFEQVVLAVHADIALRLLADPTRDERQALAPFRYAPQNVYIHLENVSPASANASAVWRFQPSTHAPQGGAALSYCISKIQGINAPQRLMLTVLGADQPPPQGVMQTIRFRRPVFSPESLRAQRLFASINGRRRTYFCGAYWGHGFHEDAVRSAEEVVERLARDAARSLSAGGRLASFI